jgi:hypothetical protein
MAPKMNMQILRHSYNPVFQTWGGAANQNPPHVQMTRSTNQTREMGGLDNMGMINRVRFAKSGCSSCGGSK